MNAILDYKDTTADSTWAPDLSKQDHDQHAPRIDECGNYSYGAIHKIAVLSKSQIQQHKAKLVEVDFESLRPYSGWVNTFSIQKTLNQSTQ